MAMMFPMTKDFPEGSLGETMARMRQARTKRLERGDPGTAATGHGPAEGPGAGGGAAGAGSRDGSGGGREKRERTPNRLGYRAGYYSRSLVTLVGKLELGVPQEGQGLLRTEFFGHYERGEKALVTALMEMYQ